MRERNVLEIHLRFVVRFNQPIGKATLRIVGGEPVGAREASIKYNMGQGDIRDHFYLYESLSYEEAKAKSVTGKYLYLAITKDNNLLDYVAIDTDRAWPSGATGSNPVFRRDTLSVKL